MLYLYHHLLNQTIWCWAFLKTNHIQDEGKYVAGSICHLFVYYAMRHDLCSPLTNTPPYCVICFPFFLRSEMIRPSSTVLIRSSKVQLNSENLSSLYMHILPKFFCLICCYVSGKASPFKARHSKCTINNNKKKKKKYSSPFFLPRTTVLPSQSRPEAKTGCAVQNLWNS